MEEHSLYSHEVTNIYQKPLRIVSGEYPQINNIRLEPGCMLQVSVAVPKGFKPYSVQYIDVTHIPVAYLGYVVDEF